MEGDRQTNKAHSKEMLAKEAPPQFAGEYVTIRVPEGRERERGNDQQMKGCAQNAKNAREKLVMG